MLSSSDTINRSACFTKSEALGDKEVLEVIDFGDTTERVLLTEAVDCDEEFIGETCNLPSGLTVGKDASLKLHSHSK